jgi:hypothetical protein
MITRDYAEGKGTRKTERFDDVNETLKEGRKGQSDKAKT